MRIIRVGLILVFAAALALLLASLMEWRRLQSFSRDLDREREAITEAKLEEWAQHNEWARWPRKGH